MTQNTRQSGGSDDRTESFMRLLNGCERGLYSYILGLVGNFADADDVDQTVKIQLWRDFDRYEPGTDFGAWARTLARYEVMALFSRKGRSRLRYSSDVVELLAEDMAVESAQSNALSYAMENCLGEVSEPNRDLLRRVYTDGSTPVQVADDLNRKVEGVYKALARTRRFLHDCIKEKLNREETA